MDISESLSGSAVQWELFWIGTQNLQDLLGRADPKVPNRERSKMWSWGMAVSLTPWVLGSGFSFSGEFSLPPSPDRNSLNCSFLPSLIALFRNLFCRPQAQTLLLQLPPFPYWLIIPLFFVFQVCNLFPSTPRPSKGCLFLLLCQNTE